MKCWQSVETQENYHLAIKFNKNYASVFVFFRHAICQEPNSQTFLIEIRTFSEIKVMKLVLIYTRNTKTFYLR